MLQCVFAFPQQVSTVSPPPFRPLSTPPGFLRLLARLRETNGIARSSRSPHLEWFLDAWRDSDGSACYSDQLGEWCWSSADAAVLHGSNDGLGFGAILEPFAAMVGFSLVEFEVDAGFLLL